jgi:flagellar basal-body rod modification protein FlgD
MSQISSVNSGSAGLGVQVTEADDLQNQFLQLLVTQMRNQDPFNTQDSGQMIEQLATFSNLEQLQGVNEKLQTQAQFSQSLSNQMMMQIVGKRVTVLGDEVNIGGGTPSRTLIRTIESGIGTAKIRDDAGNVVRTINNIRVGSGFTEIKWDGLDDDGNPLPDGDYTIGVDVEGTDGGLVDVAIFSSGIVETVQFDNNYNTVIVNGRSYSPGAIVEVGLPETRDDATEEDSAGSSSKQARDFASRFLFR